MIKKAHHPTSLTEEDDAPRRHKNTEKRGRESAELNIGLSLHLCVSVSLWLPPRFLQNEPTATSHPRVPRCHGGRPLRPPTRNAQNEPMCHSVPPAKTCHNPPKPAAIPPMQNKPTAPASSCFMSSCFMSFPVEGTFHPAPGHRSRTTQDSALRTRSPSSRRWSKPPPSPAT
jgi:hypothetical protein